jgi:hypothetical protein
MFKTIIIAASNEVNAKINFNFLGETFTVKCVPRYPPRAAAMASGIASDASKCPLVR